MWLFVLSLLSASEPAAVSDPAGERSPATLIAVAVVQAVGTTAAKVAVVTDASASAKDGEAVRTALERTDLFELVPENQASAVVLIARDRDTVIATLAGEPPRELVRVAWAPATTAEAAPVDSEALYSRVRSYERERLRVEPVMRSSMYPGFAMSTFDRRAPFGWGFGWGTPFYSVHRGWEVVRGAADIIDEAELATLLGNERLAREIEDARYRPRVYWAIGFGLGAAAALGSGIYLYDQDDRDRQAVGASLVLVGVASAALALLAPAVGGGHVISASEAERMVDDYNAQLRQRLGLSPEDVARFRE